MLNEIIENLIEAKDVLSEAESIVKIAKKKVEEHEARLIEYMDDENVEQIIHGEYKLTRSEDLLPNVKVEDYNIFKQFLGDDVKEVFTERPSKLKSFVKKLDKDGKVIPDFINVYRKQIVKVTKK